MTFDTTGLLGPQGPHSAILAESAEINGISFDGSVTGAGKTFSAMGLIRHLLKKGVKRKFIVLCPKLAIPQWNDALAKFGLKPEFIINPEKLARGNTPYYKRITPQKYQAMYNLSATIEIPLFICAEWMIPKDWLIIIDESHKYKGVDSLNAGVLFNASTQGYTVHMLSATQATTPMDMRAFGYAMGLHSRGNHSDRLNLRKFKEFCLEAGAEWVGKWGAQYFDSSKAESMAKLKRIHDFIFSEKKIGSRLTRRDFGDIFPKTQVVAESYDMGQDGDKIKAVYDNMELELRLLEERCKDYKEHVLAIITKARRQVEMLKVPTIVEMVQDYHAEGRSAVVFVNYTDTIDAIIKRLAKLFNPDLIGRIDGQTPFKQRINDIAHFQADRKLFMVANLMAGGQCINLHNLIRGGRPRSSIINPSYSAISVCQSAGRIDRAYTMSDVYQRFLFAAGTIEDKVCRNFNDKNNFVTALNEGSLQNTDLIPPNLFKFQHLIEAMQVR